MYLDIPEPVSLQNIVVDDVKMFTFVNLTYEITVKGANTLLGFDTVVCLLKIIIAVLNYLVSNMIYTAPGITRPTVSFEVSK